MVVKAFDLPKIADEMRIMKDMFAKDEESKDDAGPEADCTEQDCKGDNLWLPDAVTYGPPNVKPTAARTVRRIQALENKLARFVLTQQLLSQSGTARSLWFQ